MSWSYRQHLNAEYGKGNERLWDCPSRVIYLTFDQWLTFYQGDPEHWTDFISNSTEYHIFMCHIPVYTKIVQKTYPSGRTYEDAEYIYIKFLTRADFRKYKHYIKSLSYNGEDFENQQKIQDLANYISKIIEKRLRETQERTQKVIDENKHLMEETRLKIRAEISENEQIKLSF